MPWRQNAITDERRRAVEAQSGRRDDRRTTWTTRETYVRNSLADPVDAPVCTFVAVQRSLCTTEVLACILVLELTVVFVSRIMLPYPSNVFQSVL